MLHYVVSQVQLLIIATFLGFGLIVYDVSIDKFPDWAVGGR